jgi:hypothetical protein
MLLALVMGVTTPVAVFGSTRVEAGTGEQGDVTVGFEALTAIQSWVVPQGVTSARFDLYGGQGGSGNAALGQLTGGHGGRATATLAVTPGTDIAILVGGKGSDYVDAPTCKTTGGFNGGGDAGANPQGFDYCGQGGGGASDVRIGGLDVSNRVLVAGGGGGAAANSFCPDAGSGGGLAGQSGSRAGLCTDGGTGGNQDGTSGSGQLGFGSAGGAQSGLLAPGGGGGGGYYGGAGGGTNGYGGGGGSGFGPPGTVFETGVNEGPGSVFITYAAPGPDAEDPLANSGGQTSTLTLLALAFVLIGGVLVLVPGRLAETTTKRLR